MKYYYCCESIINLIFKSKTKSVWCMYWFLDNYMPKILVSFGGLLVVTKGAYVKLQLFFMMLTGRFRWWFCACSCYRAIAMFMMVDARCRRKCWRHTTIGCATAIIIYTEGSRITIVYFVYGWGVLMCFWYTIIEIVYFFIKARITSFYLFLCYWPSCFVWGHRRCGEGCTGC